MSRPSFITSNIHNNTSICLIFELNFPTFSSLLILALKHFSGTIRVRAFVFGFGPGSGRVRTRTYPRIYNSERHRLFLVKGA